MLVGTIIHLTALIYHSAKSLFRLVMPQQEASATL